MLNRTALAKMLSRSAARNTGASWGGEGDLGGGVVLLLQKFGSVLRSVEGTHPLVERERLRRDQVCLSDPHARFRGLRQMAAEQLLR